MLNKLNITETQELVDAAKEKVYFTIQRQRVVDLLSHITSQEARIEELEYTIDQLKDLVSLSEIYGVAWCKIRQPTIPPERKIDV